MFMAYASAARSAQLGRQVGAAIATPSGDVVAVGMNEVPSPKGGPYWDGDDIDARDHKKAVDSNFQHRDLIVGSIVSKLRDKLLTENRVREILKRVIGSFSVKDQNVGLVVDQELSKLDDIIVSEQNARAAIHASDLRHITEYGRAVHGEMDAILTCVRHGISVEGKYLYVTTFPCHNCTRHIIASGLKRVYYIEPYPKSKARELHSDAICFSEKDTEDGRIPFLPFVGIGPRRYMDLFSLELSGGRPVKRKDDSGVPFTQLKESSPPRIPMTPLSYLEREDKLLNDFHDELSRLGVENGELTGGDLRNVGADKNPATSD